MMWKILGGSLIAVFLTSVFGLVGNELPAHFHFPAELFRIALGSIVGGYVTGKHGWVAGFLAQILRLLFQSIPSIIISFIAGWQYLISSLILFASLLLIPLLTSFAVSILAGALGGWLRVKRDIRLNLAMSSEISKHE